MTSDKQKKSDCYSAGDRKLMELSQKIRGTALLPLLRLFNRLAIRPNHISFLSLLFGWGAACLIFSSRYYSALFVLFMHVLADGLDGPLARYQNISSNAGSFVDTLVDQIVIASLTIVLMDKGIVGIFPGGIYIFVYTAVVTFSMVRNAIHIPYLWMLRPRFLVYFWLILEFTLLPNTINWIVWLCNGILIINFQDGFRQLKKTIR
jgi:phosphatidylglycerophosphate synthase